MIEVVGNGTYGQVYKGRHTKTGQLAAIKVSYYILLLIILEILMQIQVLLKCSDENHLFVSVRGIFLLTNGCR